MIDRPQINPHFQVKIISNEGVFFIAERYSHILFGRIYELVTPLIDGSHSIDTIADILSDEVAPAEVYEALSALEKRGFITESVTSIPPGMAAFWSSEDINPHQAVERLSQAVVKVVCLNSFRERDFASALASFGISCGEDGDYEIVFTDDYLDPRLRTYNAVALAEKKTWMLVKPIGEELWLGPQFYPEQTACWNCLEHRLRYNRRVEEFVQQQLQLSIPLVTSRVSTTSTQQLALHLSAIEMARWIAGSKTLSLVGKIISIDIRSLQVRNHTLVKRPQCLACGTVGAQAHVSQPMLRLQSRKKGLAGAGRYRTVTPEETFRKYEHHISPITGIIPSLDFAGSKNAPVFVAGHNAALKFKHLRSLRKNLRNKSAGKGRTSVQAKTSAICEAIERYSGIYQGYEPIIYNSMAELGEQAIHPNECMLFSAKQYEERASWNAKPSLFNRVPVPFDEQLKIQWSPVFSLTQERVRYLPTAYLYFSSPYMAPSGATDSCVPDSNGNASGNTIEEAILHGFYELIERDAVALWWYNRLRKPIIDLSSFNDSYFLRLQEYYKTLNRELWVLDLTSDLNIPACVAISRRTDQLEEDILLGFGAHHIANVAVERALTEMNQMVLSSIPGQNTKDPNEDCFDETSEWFRAATIENQSYLKPDNSLPARRLSDFMSLQSDDFLTDLLACRKAVEDRGMEVLVLDLTRPDIGLSVVKVIVPGLRHFWARYAPGRLYQVPVEMGWLNRPLEEEQLNPIPMFL
jgi:ribosomal protein S12 methylthiotransferase accessory factor